MGNFHSIWLTDKDIYFNAGNIKCLRGHTECSRDLAVHRQDILDLLVFSSLSGEQIQLSYFS